MSSDKKNQSSGVRIISLSKLIPNMLTILALCAGLTGLRFAIIEKWEWAVMAILIAAVLDALDGAMARLLKASSQLGAELDSLSDFLSFGIAPSLVVYLWLTQDAKGFGWFAALIFAVATALRLARFNAESKKELETGGFKAQSMYFQGIPSPAGAFLALWPIIIYNYFEVGFLPTFEFMPHLIAAWVIVVAVLMVSKIPTFSVKKLKLPQKLAIPMLAALGLVFAALITQPWLSLSIIALLYLISIPFSVRNYMRMKKRSSEEMSLF